MGTSLVSLYNEAYAHYHLSAIGREFLDKTLRESQGMLQLVDEIKQKFYAEIPWSQMRVAELGCGAGGLAIALALRGAQVVAIDFVERALELNRQLCLVAGVEVEQKQMDLSLPGGELSGQFDLMIDSHLLHCLPLAPDRASYLRFVYDHLRGHFIGETMAHRKKIFIPPGYRFDEDHVLWQKFSDWVPIRKISDSLWLEEEFKNAGFFINYFYYYANYAFAVNEEFSGMPSDLLPASVRFALKTARP
jgi:SAM-dependent methyltransferase